VETNTNQSFNAIGVDTTFSVILVDTAGTESYLSDTRLRDLIDTGVVDSTQIGVSAFEVSRLRTPGAWQVLQRAFSGSSTADVRTETYGSRASASLQPRLSSPSLRWITIQDISYSANFSWRNGSVGNNTGAQATTTVTTRAGLTLRPLDLIERLPLYERLRASEVAAQAAAEVRRAERAQLRQERRAKRLEQRRQAREAAAADSVLAEDDAPAQEPAPPDTTARRGFPISVPAFLYPKTLLRRTLLAILGIQDININYSGSRRINATNVGRVNPDGTVAPSYSLYDAIFNGKGPSVGYRLGFEETIAPGTDRIINDRLQVSDLNTNNNRLQGRATLRPTQQLQITLNFSLEQEDQSTLTYRMLPDGTPGADTTQSGGNTASVWAFGSNAYEKLFQLQLDRYYNDCGPECEPGGTLPDTVHSSVLTNSAVVDDFIGAYLALSGMPRAGGVPFPLPGWRLNYTGISNWPIIRAFTSSATLRHSFNAQYSSDFRSNLRGGDPDAFGLAGGPLIAYELPSVEVEAIRINKRFQPLVGLDLSFGRGIQTSFSWNRTRSYSLSTTNNVITDIRENELTLTASYSVTGLRLPFLSNRLNNRINFSLTVSHRSDNDRSFYVRRALEAAITNPDFVIGDILQEPYTDVLTNTSSLQIHPKIAYQFSNVVSADMFVRYEDFIGDSRQLPFTKIEGGFNVRINFSN